MKSQTSLVAQQTRLMEWAKQIKDCQSRPIEISVEDWCQNQGITRANYYYRLRKVREACLSEVQNQNTTFVELPAIPSISKPKDSTSSDKVVAILRGPGSLSIEILENAKPDLIQTLIGAFAYAK
ncbi:MAG: IS66 family insertion sequence element accessory protein TnpB [Clostridia bacterium]|nr:IS66 family insertion sequence element accessory protein TnpB [Clostridia bacterium]